MTTCKARFARYIFMSIISLFPALRAADIGSDTSVTRISTQQVVFDGDRIAGFASLEGGFRFFGSQVNATFDSFFPVSGKIELNGGTLTLNRDLLLRNDTIFGLQGNIIGNCHAIELFSSVTCVPLLSVDEISCGIVLTTSTSLDSDCEAVDWSFDSKFIAVGKDGRVAGIDTLANYELLSNNSLVLRDSFDPAGDRTEMNDVRWRPGEYLLAVVRDEGSGDEVLTYTSSSGGILTLVSSATVAGDAVGCVWHLDGDILAVSTTVAANELVFYPVDMAGNLGTRTVFNITPDRIPQFESIDFSPDGNYLAVGVADDGGTNPELLIYHFTKSPITLTLAASTIFGKDVECLDWNPTFTQFVAVGLDDTGPAGELVQVQEFDPVGGTLTTRAFGVSIGGPVSAMDWRSDGQCLAVGRGLTASNHFLRTYAFDPVGTTTLRVIDELVTVDDVESVRWSPDGDFLAVGRDGIVVPDVGALFIFQNPLSLGLTTCFELRDVKLSFNSDIIFKNSCFKFTGHSVINGHGNVLSLNPTTTFIVGENSSLLIKDVILKGISGNQLAATDGTSTFSFQDVKMVLDGNYSFTVGRFDVIKDFEVAGDGFNFNYQTDQVSTITTYGRFILDNGVTFSYDPGIASQNLINFSDDNSELILRSATLHSTAVGLQLLKGYMQIEGLSFLSAEGPSAATGILFGDGVSAANNFCIEWLSAANLELLQGFATYDNV